MAGHALSDPESFSVAYREHWPAVVRSAQAILHDLPLAEDVACEVFSALWRHPDRFDPERGELGSYLRLLARSRAVDALRSGASYRRATERLAALPPEPAPLDPAAAVERRDERAKLLAAVRTLPDAQRTAVALTFWGGLSSGELAERTGAKVPTAKSRTRLALERLRTELANSARPSTAERA